MFESLSNNLSKVFSKLKGKGVLSEDDVALAMREIRVALLEADVALPVVKKFIAAVKEKAVGEAVVKSVSPAQMVVKIVNDELVEMLGSEEQPVSFTSSPPDIYMIVGLQGSGKTTSTAKLAHWLQKNHKKKVLMASLDVYRPAAQQQLETLGKDIGIDSLEVVPEQKPEAITKRALKEAKLGGYDVLLLDTAGRLHIDEVLMKELQAVEKMASPKETWLVADALTGQDAVHIAESFNDQLSLSGIVLTRIDGDGRGGAALSMRQITGCPIKFLGVGEKTSAFELFHADRIASRILGMGDVVSLVEKAVAEVEEEDAQRMEARFKKGIFDLNDLVKQLKMMRKMGGLGGIMGMLPGIGKIKKQLDSAQIDDNIFVRMEAIVSSMTKGERQYPKTINASRKKRIAKGAGVDVQDVNRLLKQHKQMAQMMKKMSKMDKKSLMRGGLGQLMSQMPKT
jgi:signal recognition particle subunit SRP54